MRPSCSTRHAGAFQTISRCCGCAHAPWSRRRDTTRRCLVRADGGRRSRRARRGPDRVRSVDIRRQCARGAGLVRVSSRQVRQSAATMRAPRRWLPTTWRSGRSARSPRDARTTPTGAPLVGGGQRGGSTHAVRKRRRFRSRRREAVAGRRAMRAARRRAQRVSSARCPAHCRSRCAECRRCPVPLTQSCELTV